MKTKLISIKTFCLGIPMLLLTLTTGMALAQQAPPPTPGLPPPSRNFSERLSRIISPESSSPAAQALTRFDLDFPGGSPAELVAAIQRALGRPLNAIVPEEFASVKLPALNMKNVHVAMLFDALAAASRKTEAVTMGAYGSHPAYTTALSGYGFRTEGPPTDDSIWYFYVEKPTLPPASPAPLSVCRFYSLAPYLENGLTVDDITTAIETGWKMLQEAGRRQGANADLKSEPQQPATIRFHKDTKLLIAVGDPRKLEVIDDVLNALKPKQPEPQFRRGLLPLPAPKPAEQPKTEK